MSAPTLTWTRPIRRLQAPGGLPAAAFVYLIQTGIAAAAATGSLVTVSGPARWPAAAAILAGAAIAQAAAFHTRGNQVFHTGLAFTVAAAVVLPPAAVVAVCVLQHIPDWLRKRYPWYIQSFNIANYVLSALAAWAVNHELTSLLAGGGTWSTGQVAASAAAGTTFVLTNHALLVRMLRLARGHSRPATGLFGLDGLVADLVLASTGVGIGLALVTHPATAVLAASPLVLIHRALAIPRWRAQALEDHKTGLLNSRGLESAAAPELARAARFARPLSVIVADVDNLREINNRHGHLAGDAALRAVANALSAETRDFDICARFGGDEFVIVLPETDDVAADEIKTRIAHRVRRTVVAEGFAVAVSLGSATTVGGQVTLEQLVRQADAMMYTAKRRAS